MESQGSMQLSPGGPQRSSPSLQLAAVLPSADLERHTTCTLEDIFRRSYSRWVGCVSIGNSTINYPCCTACCCRCPAACGLPPPSGLQVCPYCYYSHYVPRGSALVCVYCAVLKCRPPILPTCPHRPYLCRPQGDRPGPGCVIQPATPPAARVVACCSRLPRCTVQYAARQPAVQASSALQLLQVSVARCPC